MFSRIRKLLESLPSTFHCMGPSTPVKETGPTQGVKAGRLLKAVGLKAYPAGHLRGIASHSIIAAEAQGGSGRDMSDGTD